MFKRKTRIELTDTLMTSVVKLVDGNPGAIGAVMEVMKAAPSVDPDAAMGEIGFLLDLDQRGIYGSRIWILFKDVCGCDPTKVLAVLRADQLGQLAGVTEEAINRAIDNHGAGLDVDAALAAVKERLPAFGRATECSQQS